jgi:hypothetical protein
LKELPEDPAKSIYTVFRGQAYLHLGGDHAALATSGKLAASQQQEHWRAALILLLAIFPPLVVQSQQAAGTPLGFLVGQGQAGAKLERRVGNHLFVPVSTNKRRAALMIDTGAPVSP